MVDPQTFSAKQRRDQQAFAKPPRSRCRTSAAASDGIGWKSKHQRAIERRNCQRNHLYANK